MDGEDSLVLSFEYPIFYMADVVDVAADHAWLDQNQLPV